MPPRDGVVQVLVVGEDPTLGPELDAALVGIGSQRVITHHVAGHRQGVEVARYRSPDIVCVEMGRDLARLKAFVRDIVAVAPQTFLAAVYRHEDLAGHESAGQVVIEAMRARVQDFLRRPISSVEVQQLLDRRLHGAEAPAVSLGRVVAFVSNKGGVGKSTLAVNTAVALAARHPGRVLLVDAALQAGACAQMLDLTPPSSLVDAARERERLDETLVHQLTTPHPSGLRLLASPADAIEGAEVTDGTVSRVLGLGRQRFDYVIVDTFPMVGRFLLSILDLSDLAYMIIQPTVTGVMGAVGLLRTLDHVGFGEARQRVVLCHNFPSFPGDLRPEDAEESLGRGVDHWVAYDRRVIRSANAGMPYILHSGAWRGFGRTVGQIATEIELTRGEASPPRPWWRRLSLNGRRRPRVTEEVEP